MSQKALRHQVAAAPQEFDVLKDNKDGTVDLGRNGELIIGSCIVSEKPTAGTCTLVKAQKAEKAPKPDKAQAKKIEEAEAALAQAKAALEAEPSNDTLKAAAIEAQAALDALLES